MPRRWLLSSPAWAEQGEHAAVGVGEVGDDHAVLQRHWRDDDLAAQVLGLGGGRGDVCDLDDENGVRRDVAAGVEDPTGWACRAGGGDQRVGPVGGKRPAEQWAVESLGSIDGWRADLEPGDGVIGGSGHAFLRPWATCPY